MKANLPFLVLPIADRVEEELLARVREGGGAALGLGLLTIRDLERRLFAAAGLAPLDPLATELLVGEVAPAAARGTALERVAAEAGFPRAFLSVWNALREGGCGLAELSRLARKIDGLTGLRLKAIRQIAAAYEEACERLGIIDANGARLALADRLETLELPSDLARAEAIVIEDVVDLPVVRVRMLEGLVRRGIRTILRLPAFEGRTGLAPSMEVLQKALESDGPGIEVDWKRQEGGALTAFQQRLFDSNREPVPDAPVELIQADDPMAELRAVAAEARRRIDAGVSPDDIWIAARNLSQIRQAMGQALDTRGIPWRERRGAAALDAPPIRLALAFLEGAERLWPRDRLGELLTSRYVAGGVPGTDTLPYVPPRDLMEMLRAAASRDDRGEGHGSRLAAWGRRLAAAEDRKAPQVERAAVHLDALLGPLRLPREATADEFARRLVRGLESLGVVARSRAKEASSDGDESHFGDGIEEATAAAVARDQAAIRALSTWLSTLTAAAKQVGVADKILPLSRFRSLVEAGIAQLRLPSRGARGGAVRLIDVSELPGRRCPHLILAGVVDGGFPWRRSGEPLLEEADRDAVNLAAGRAIFRWRAPEEPLLFALACHVPQESLVVTASRLDADGRELIPSPFFEEAAASLGGKAARLVEGAVVPGLEACGNQLELLTRMALDSSSERAADAQPWLDVPALGAALSRARAGAQSGYGLSTRGGLLRSAAPKALAEQRLAGPSPLSGQGPSGTFEDASLPVAWRASVTALEDYATCPFRFFAKRLLDVPEARTDSDELDAREGGTLLHAVAAEVFTSLGEVGLLPLQGGPRSGQEQEVALAAAERALDEWQAKERLGPTPLWSLTRDQARRAVVRWLEAEVRKDSDLLPHEFEKAFGDEGEPPLLLPSPDGREAISLKGRVDRVDRSLNGDSVEVIDYKSGRVQERVKAAEMGRSNFQLPVYAAWARQRYQADQVDASLRSLRDGASSRSLAAVCERAEIPLGSLLEMDPERRAALRAGAPVGAASGALALPDDGDPNLADAAWSFVFAIREGRFDVRPNGETVCGYCSYAPVCRITETGGGQ